MLDLLPPASPPVSVFVLLTLWMVVDGCAGDVTDVTHQSQPSMNNNNNILLT